MFDVRAFRQDPQRFQNLFARRGAEDLFDTILRLDENRRKIIAQKEELQARRNEFTAEVQAGSRRPGADLRQLSDRIKDLQQQERQLTEQYEQGLAHLPNLPDPQSPDEDTIIKTVGETRHHGLEHMELAQGLIDLERAREISGSRFVFLRGSLVRLQYALIQYAIDLLSKQGFEPVIPPILVREQSLFGTGFLPDAEGQVYEIEKDDLFLAGTAEVPLAAQHQGEILRAEDLPLRYLGISTCFRREAGAAGRDVGGLFRVHQFDKIEMFSFVPPDQAREEHERILALEERILTDFALPYRVVNIAVHDLGNSAAQKYDCEVWLPGQGRYRELTSCSNTTDYQTRRLGIRYRVGSEKRYPYTLNGTAIALGRMIIALLENGQQPDGSVIFPPILQQYGAPAGLHRGDQ